MPVKLTPFPNSGQTSSVVAPTTNSKIKLSPLPKVGVIPVSQPTTSVPISTAPIPQPKVPAIPKTWEQQSLSEKTIGLLKEFPTTIVNTFLGGNMNDVNDFLSGKYSTTTQSTEKQTLGSLAKNTLIDIGKFASTLPSTIGKVGLQYAEAPLRVVATAVEPWVDFATGSNLSQQAEGVPMKIGKFDLGPVPTLFQTYNAGIQAGMSPLEAGLVSGSGTAMDLAVSVGMAEYFLGKTPVKINSGEFVPTGEVGKGGKMKMEFGDTLDYTKPDMSKATYWQVGKGQLLEVVPTDSGTLKITAYNVSRSGFQNLLKNMGDEIKNFGITYNEQIPPTKEFTIPPEARKLLESGLKNITPEQAIDQLGGWKPGVKAKFDMALFDKNAVEVKNLLPQVPAEYKQRFAAEINNIVGSPQITPTSAPVVNPIIAPNIIPLGPKTITPPTTNVKLTPLPKKGEVPVNPVITVKPEDMIGKTVEEVKKLTQPQFQVGDKIIATGINTGADKPAIFVKQTPEGIIAREPIANLPILYRNTNFTFKKATEKVGPAPLAQEAKYVPARSVPQQRIYGNKFIQGIYNGKPYTTDSFILEFNSNAIAPKKATIIEQKDAPTQQAIEEIIPKGNLTKAEPTKVFTSNTNYSMKDVEMIRLGSGKKSEVMQRRYYDYFIKKYPNAEFYISDESMTPILVKENGANVGLIMPVVKGAEETNIIWTKKSVLPKKTSVGKATKIGISEKPKMPEIREKQGYSVNEVSSEEILNKKTGDLGFNPKNLDNLEGTSATKEVKKIVKRSEIAKQLSEKLGVPIRRGKFNQKALGIFKRGPQVVRVKKGGLGTIFHEVGHFLDAQMNISTLIGITERRALMTEYGYEYANQPRRQQEEAFAEFLRYRLTGQEEKIQKYAPNFAKEFDNIMEQVPEIKDVLDTAKNDFQRWKEMPAVSKVLSQISTGAELQAGLSDRISNGLHNLYTMALDDLHPLSSFSTLGKKLGISLSADKDPYILARNLRGWVGKANTFLTKGTFGKDYFETVNGKTKPVFIGKSFEEIVKPISKAGKLDDFRVYIVAKRAIELSARKIVTGIKVTDAQEALAELGTKNPEFEKASQDLIKYQDDLLNYAYENGLIGSEGMNKIKTLNKFRVPFYRVMEAERSGFMGGKKIAGNLGSPIKKIRGSEREIIDPLEGIVKDTYAIINSAERNNIAIAMANLASQNVELGRLFEKVDRPMMPVKVNIGEVMKGAMNIMGAHGDTEGLLTPELDDLMVTLFRPTQDRGPNMLNVNIGNKQLVFQVDPDLFKAIQGLNNEDVGAIIRILSMPSRILRAGATLTPDFSIRNPLRDQFSAFIYSKFGYKPGIDLVRGIFEVFKGMKGTSEVYDLWRMAGGEHSMFVSLDRTKLQKNLDELLRSKGASALNIIRHPIEALRIVSEVGEQATRLAEMKRGLNQGASPIEAAFASREITLDFARIGAKTKALNALIAFWNANVQGMDKLVRAFKERPYRILLKVLVGITLPSILLYFANRKDKRYKEIPAWQKDLFWIVLTPNHIFRIPKPFEVGILFGSVPERILEFMDNKDPGIFNQLEADVANGATPGMMPTFMAPIIENITNYSFFLNRPIVPQGKQALPAEAQYGTYTSELAKIIGNVLNYSPAKIDNLLQGYTGGLGKYVVSGIDSILQGTGITHEPISPDKTLADWPIIKAFMIRPPIGTNSESVNKIYTMYASVTGQYSYLKNLVDAGETDKAKAFIKSNPEVINYKIISGTIQYFADINKARESVRESKTMSGSEKLNKITRLDTLQTELAQKILVEIKSYAK